MRELDALDSSSCSGGKADGAGYVLGASSLKIIGWNALFTCFADNVVRELEDDQYLNSRILGNTTDLPQIVDFATDSHNLHVRH